MPKKPIYLTKKGLKKMQRKYRSLLKKIKHLRKKEKVPRILHSEEPNPEYLSFQEDLELLENRIVKIEEALTNAKIIEKPPKGKRNEVRVGATVEVEVDGKKDEFTIVGSAEADPSRGFISNECPVGKSLLGHKVGEEVEVSSPTKVTYKIRNISYSSL